MADPLDQVKDNQRRLQLMWLRAHEGEILQSKQLRELVQGFKSEMGIHKPRGDSHALWVRQTLRGTYPDKDPVDRADGGWTFRYSPEGRAGRPDMNLPTNKSLLQCMDDGVPIGVFRQRRVRTGGSTYEVLGLAYVEGFDGEHFHLRSEQIEVEKPPSTESSIPFVAFEEKKVSTVARQRRDSRFVVKVKRAYRDKCAACSLGFQVRGSTVGLQAAHIIPATKRGTSLDVRNGMLLCANHHALFDGFGWAFDEDYRVIIADDKDFRRSAAPNHILGLEGKIIPNLPPEHDVWPDPEAILFRLKEFETFWASSP